MSTESPTGLIMYHTSPRICRVGVFTSASGWRGIVDQAVIEVDIALVGMCCRLLLVIIVTLNLFKLVLLNLNTLSGRKLKRAHRVIKYTHFLWINHDLTSVQIWFYVSWNFGNNGPTIVSDCVVHEQDGPSCRVVIMVNKWRTLACNSIHYELLFSTCSGIVPLRIQIVNHLSAIFRNSSLVCAVAPLMQSSSAWATIENILCCYHLRRQRWCTLHVGLSCSCIVHAEVMLYDISIPHHVLLSDGWLWLPILAILQWPARQRQLSCPVHLTNLVWIWAAHKYLWFVLILLVIFFNFHDDRTLVIVSRSICSIWGKLVT